MRSVTEIERESYLDKSSGTIAQKCRPNLATFPLSFFGAYPLDS